MRGTQKYVCSPPAVCSLSPWPLLLLLLVVLVEFVLQLLYDGPGRQPVSFFVGYYTAVDTNEMLVPRGVSCVRRILSAHPPDSAIHEPAAKQYVPKLSGPEMTTKTTTILVFYYRPSATSTQNEQSVNAQQYIWVKNHVASVPYDAVRLILALYLDTHVVTILHHPQSRSECGRCCSRQFVVLVVFKFSLRL